VRRVFLRAEGFPEGGISRGERRPRRSCARPCAGESSVNLRLGSNAFMQPLYQTMWLGEVMSSIHKVMKRDGLELHAFGDGPMMTRGDDGEHQLDMRNVFDTSRNNLSWERR